MSILGVVAGAISAIGSIVKSLAVVELAIRGLKAVIGLLVNVAKSLGLIEEPDPVLAEKALQAEEDEGITPDDFDTYEEFKEEIEGYEIDPEKQHTETEILQKEAELLARYIGDMSPEMNLEPLICAVGNNPDYFTTERMSEIGKVIADSPANAELIGGLLNGTEKNSERLGDAEKLLIQAEKNLDPNISSDEALIQIYRNTNN